MKELYIEGLASHNGHESCAGGRKAAREALDSGTRRLGIEPRKFAIQVPTRLQTPEGNTTDVNKRDIRRLGVVVDPTRDLSREDRDRHMRENSMHGNRESPESTAGNGTAVRIGNPKGAS